MLKILSIDDSKAVHAFLDRMFAGSSHTLTHVMEGADGLKLLAKGDKFDVVLLDFEMPNMTGSQVLEQIKQRSFNVPVIMMTSKNDPSLIAEMLEKGASEYIMKPFTPDIVSEKIGSVLGVECKLGGK